MTPSILAKQAEVPLFTVRYYTRIGLLKPTRDSHNGYKIYQPSDETRLRFIIAAKELGFTLAEIAEILGEARDGNSPCPMVREIVSRRIEENRRKIADMKKLQKKMEKALSSWSSMENSMPDGRSVCHLIESVAESEE
ncbi:MAG: MerR family DNA-binding protein [Pyrinomonadaceae bacterium]